MSESLGQLIVELTADNASLKANLRRAEDYIKGYEKTANNKLRKASQEWDNHAVNMKSSLSSIKRVVGSVLAAMGAKVGFEKALREFSILDKGLIAVQKTTDFTSKEMILFRKELEQTATQLPVSAKGLLEIAEAAGQLGVKGVANVTNFTRTLAKLQMSTDVIGAEGAKSLARLLNTAGEGTDKIDELGAVIVELGNNMAASESEIIHIASEIGRGAAAYGMASEHALALGAAMKSLGARAELSSTAISRTMVEIEKAILNGGDSFKYLQEVTKMSGDQLRESFQQDATGVFREVIKGFGRMTKEGYSSVELLDKFGLKSVEVIKGLSPLIENVALMENAFNLANKEVKNSVALDKEALKAAESFSAQMQMTKNVLDQVFVVIGENLAPVIVDLAKDFRNWIQENEEFIHQDLAQTVKDSAEAFRLFASGLAKVLHLIVQINNALPKGLKETLLFVTPGTGAITQLNKYLGLTKEIAEETKKIEAPKNQNIKMGGSHSNIATFTQLAEMKKKSDENEARRVAVLAKMQKEEALKTAEVKKKALEDFAKFYDEIMLSTYEQDKKVLDAQVAKLKETLGDKEGLQIAYNTALAKLQKERDEGIVSGVDSSLTDYFKEIDAKTSAERDLYNEKMQMQKEFSAEHNSLFMSEKELELNNLNERYEYYKKFVTDKVALEEWYAESANKINNYANLSFTDSLAKGTELALQNIKKQMMTTTQMVESGVGQAIDGVTSALDAWVSGTKSFKDAFKDMAKEVLSNIASMIMKQAIYNALVSDGTSGGSGGGSGGGANWGGIVSSVVGAMFHGGGVVGSNESAGSRILPANTFTNAPKFHSGLLPNEFAAVLKKDEGVFTPEQMEALGKNMGSNTPSQPINVTNNFTVNTNGNGNISKASQQQMAAATYSGMKKATRRR